MVVTVEEVKPMESFSFSSEAFEWPETKAFLNRLGIDQSILGLELKISMSQDSMCYVEKRFFDSTKKDNK